MVRFLRCSTPFVALFGLTWAATLQQPFEYMVAPATDSNQRNSEADIHQFRDGSLLLAWTDFYTGQGSDWAPSRISAMTSRDGGRGWGPRFTLQENIGRMNVMEPDLLRLKSGKVLFLFARKNSEADCAPMVRISTDDGHTFGPPQPLPIDPAPSYTGFNHDRAIQLHSGRILMPLFFTTDYRVDPHIRSRVYYSDDDGANWHAGRTILDVPADKAGAQEPGVVELTDGSVLLWVRTGQGSVYRALSTDHGETFTQPETMNIESPLSPQSIKRIPTTGDLLLVWNYSATRRFPLTAAISHDDGRSWTQFRNLDQDPAHTYAYTSLTFLKDRALFTYYAGPPSRSSGGNRWNLKLKAVPPGWFYDPNVIVALGDSVTWGIRPDGSVKNSDTFVSVLERSLATLHAHVINAGVGGNNSAQMLARLDHDVLAYKPRLVMIMAGLNDASYVDPGPAPRREPRIPVPEYSRNLAEIIRRVRAAGSQALLVTPNPMTSRYPYVNFGWYQGKDINAALTGYVEAVRSLSREQRVPLVDIYRDYTTWKGYRDTLPDGIHPDRAGHAFIAGRLLPACSRLLRKK
ncbi:MAG: exo-alpha-sialidase [Bryobacterales bacterium]|nr:exo-alpha-sialidase [Bryobacterales bacterium]